MQQFDITKTQFRVTDFLNWQRQGSLVLNPPFQRRSVWKPDAKSYFIDTVVRGLPAPIIYIREQTDLDSQTTKREVIDGQQRLRTLFAFIDHTLLDDFKSSDLFTVKKVHNPEIGNLCFKEFPKEIKEKILSYQFSTHTLPINVDDRDVLQMFARLNATGTKLNNQELRNAEFFGEFKTLMYKLALQQLEKWRIWRIFSNDDISRMKEVETTSDLVMNMIEGLSAKTKTNIDSIYKKYDDKFLEKDEIERRFLKIINKIDDLINDKITDSIYTLEVFFFTLFIYLYDTMYGLGSDLSFQQPNRLPPNLKNNLLKASKKIKEIENIDESENPEVPLELIDAIRQKRADKARRQIRLEYLGSICNA